VQGGWHSGRSKPGDEEWGMWGRSCVGGGMNSVDEEGSAGFEESACAQ
jgi:hypothetical protein